MQRQVGAYDSSTIDDAATAVREQLCDPRSIVLLDEDGVSVSQIVKRDVQRKLHKLRPFQTSRRVVQHGGPAAAFVSAPSTVSSVPLHLDVLVFVSKFDHASAVEIVLSGVLQQLNAAVDTLKRFVAQRHVMPSGVTCCHYLLPVLTFPVTVVFPVNAMTCASLDESTLLEWRVKLHHTFRLNTDRPYFRFANATSPGAS